MHQFPPVLPDPARRFSTRSPRDHYVRVETNDYSVNPRFIGRRIEVRVDLRLGGGHLRGDRGGPAPALPGQAPVPVGPRPRHDPAQDARGAGPAPGHRGLRRRADLADYDKALGVA